MKWYLAGPMSGIPQFNFPTFQRACEYLRGDGLEIVSPHEEDSPEMQKLAWASPDGVPHQKDPSAGVESWGEVLARDVRLVADEIGGIIFLPHWWKSRGARLEAFTGLLTQKQFAFFNPERPFMGLDPLDADTVRQIIRENMP